MSEPTPFATITSIVSQRIGSSNDAVKERVIEHLVEVEVKRRTELVVQAVAEVSKLKKALDKIHPDIKSYNEDGSEATSAWSKAKLEERKKATEALSKVEKALDKALSKGDYGDLLNVKFGGGKDEPASN